METFTNKNGQCFVNGCDEPATIALEESDIDPQIAHYTDSVMLGQLSPNLSIELRQRV